MSDFIRYSTNTYPTRKKNDSNKPGFPGKVVQGFTYDSTQFLQIHNNNSKNTKKTTTGIQTGPPCKISRKEQYNEVESGCRATGLFTSRSKVCSYGVKEI